MEGFDNNNFSEVISLDPRKSLRPIEFSNSSSNASSTNSIASTTTNNDHTTSTSNQTNKPIDSESVENVNLNDIQSLLNDSDSGSEDDFKHAPAKNTRSKTKVMYSNLSIISLQDAISAIVNGEHFDNNYANIFNSEAELALLSYDSLTEEDVLLSPQRDRWIAAMKQEIDKLTSIRTWTIVNSLPPDRKALKHKWVLKTKTDLNNNLIYKARLTVKGCSQREGFDFEETFSPVAQISALRLLLSLVSFHHMILWQFDVQNAFPNAELKEYNIFMEPPLIMNLPPSSYLKLHRALYGLKQASREWNIHLVKILKHIGFKQLISEPCLFIAIVKGEQMILLIYVDDMIVCLRLYENIVLLHNTSKGRTINDINIRI